ncbi:MAG: glycine cleavage system aminomethyltransferase GcvT [Acidimicrobiales bacterium]|nr:glycine cleavage system aminomethyltransferase GcvT [Acidimicrobiales bacterium]
MLSGTWTEGVLTSHSDEVPAVSEQLKTTPLHRLHQELGARLVPFAGWEMPIQYEGVVAEHNWCRSSAALFDVSHMAVVELWGDHPAAALETVSPAAFTTLGERRQRYGLFTTDDGGIIDDFMAINWGDHFTVVVNASRAHVDIPHLTERLDRIEVRPRPDIALIALQGPEAADVVIGHDPSLSDTVFLDTRMTELGGLQAAAFRAGYTGEDGFELAVDTGNAEALARLLLSDERVRPAGLGARDTLRLEAGLCLYGNDLDLTTSPVEADLKWTIPKRRREAGDFPGAERILREWAEGPSRIRVGLAPQGRRPVRDGAELRPSPDSDPVGVVSSGGFGPTVEAPVAMGYLPPELAELGTEVIADVRGNDVVCTVASLPFTPHRFNRGA